MLAYALTPPINTRPHVGSLKGNNIGDDGMRAIGNALLSAASSSVCALGCDAFDVPRDAASLDLSSKGLGPAAAVLLAGVLRGNSSITKLKYAATFAPSSLLMPINMPSFPYSQSL